MLELHSLNIGIINKLRVEARVLVGRFIVIEGIDSAGKKTQAQLLEKYLTEKGINTKLLHFPQYETKFGALVGNYLRGEYGKLDELAPEIPCLLYALDRYQFKDQLIQDLRSDVFYVADRYTQSNIGFQGAKLQDQARWDLILWIEQLESRIPQPDLVIYLHIPVEISQKLMGERTKKEYLKGAAQDMHEADPTYQKQVVETYLEVAEGRQNWIVIDCVTDNKLKSVDDIQTEIQNVVRTKLGI
jgi:dTMP kinase